MIDDLQTVTKTEIRKALQTMKDKGYRMITIVASLTKDNKLELTYPLESWKDRKFAAVRTTYELTEEVKSVQDIYMNAMFYEWEIVDLFDVKVENCPAGIYLEPEKRGCFRRDV